MSRANQITNNIIQLASMQGCKVFRNNVMGVFDQRTFLGKLHDLIMFNQIKRIQKLSDFIKENRNLSEALHKSYRKSNEEKGASDILGMCKTGKFIAIEIKAKGDQLDKDGGFNQENFLKEVGQKGGLAFIVAEEPDKIRLRVMGSEKYITVCNEDDFLKLLIQKMKTQ